jgi:hypothetical protein
MNLFDGVFKTWDITAFLSTFSGGVDNCDRRCCQVSMTGVVKTCTDRRLIEGPIIWDGCDCLASGKLLGVHFFNPEKVLIVNLITHAYSTTRSTSWTAHVSFCFLIIVVEYMRAISN